ncbi:MAG: ABC transporter permease [Rhodospirillales bacterium]|nr:ABC transporter permease [Rhodospirillales bacterium]
MRRPRPWSPEAGYRAWIILPALFMLAFFVIPLGRVLFTSLSPADGIGLGAYQALFRDAVFSIVLLETLRIALMVTLGCLVLAYPVAYVVAELRGRWQRLALAMILLPFWTSAVIRSYAWLVIFQRQGPFNQVLLGLGVIDRPLRPLNSGLALDVGMLHIMLPFMLLPLLSAMWRIDRRLLLAASVLGAPPWRQFVHVYLRLSLPGVAAGCALVFITSLGFYITPALLGGSGTMMVSQLIYQQASRLLNWPLASASGSVLLILTSVLFVLYQRIGQPRTARRARPPVAGDVAEGRA